MLLVITVAVGITKVAALNEGTKYIVQNKLPKIEMAHTLLESVDTVAIASRNMVLNADANARKREEQAIMDARKHDDSVMERIDATHVTPVGMALVLATLVGWMTTRRLLKQLGGEPDYAADIAAQIAAGNLGVAVAVGADDRSSLVFAMESMRAQLRPPAAQARLAYA
jgi:methyl-accepting chemotaxis protein